VMLLRPVRWDYFYDEIGRGMVGLVRRLLALRKTVSEFRHGGYFFYNDYARYQSRGLLLFSRLEGPHFSLVALNFTDHEQTVPFWFPLPGNYIEQLHGQQSDERLNVAALSEQWLTIPSHYGRVWRKL
jgi:maltooligosyltrehalose trehalohydrolase